MMNIGVFVEVVAVFTNVVQLGVYGSVVLPSAASTSLSEVTTSEIKITFKPASPTFVFHT